MGGEGAGGRGAAAAAAVVSERRQQMMRAELANSQQQVQSLQQLLLERNVQIQQLSEELVGVSDDIERFKETVFRCEAVASHLRAQQQWHPEEGEADLDLRAAMELKAAGARALQGLVH